MSAEAFSWTPADELRKARRAAGLDQGELAELLGVSRKTVSNWENGHGEPTISVWRAIARHCQAVWLLNDDLIVHLNRHRLTLVR